MKVVAFNGSPRKDGNTAHILNKVLEPIRLDVLEFRVRDGQGRCGKRRRGHGKYGQPGREHRLGIEEDKRVARQEIDFWAVSAK